MFEKMGGLAGMLKAAGDRAAAGMYGKHAGKLRDHVWQDLISGIGESLGGGDVLGPMRSRLAERYRRQSSPWVGDPGAYWQPQGPHHGQPVRDKKIPKKLP